MMDLRGAADRRKVLGRALEHNAQLLERVVGLVQLDERASERDASGEIAGMNGEAGAAHLDRFFVAAGAPAFFGELRKRNRRRILLDPASKIVNPLILGHRRITGR